MSWEKGKELRFTRHVLIYVDTLATREAMDYLMKDQLNFVNVSITIPILALWAHASLCELLIAPEISISKSPVDVSPTPNKNRKTVL